MAVLIVTVMSVSSFVLFLHPLDEVFYPGMLIVLLQNYLWLVLVVRPDDWLAYVIHPYLHVSNEGTIKNWLVPFKRTKKTRKTEINFV
jgi:hypothetical protein